MLAISLLQKVFPFPTYPTNRHGRQYRLGYLSVILHALLQTESISSFTSVLTTGLHAIYILPAEYMFGGMYH
jgi:hypothetical protein